MNATEKRWDKDRPAYKALRKQGYQPRSFNGAHRLQDAKDAFEVETTRYDSAADELRPLFNDDERKVAREIMKITDDNRDVVNEFKAGM